jgi:hypothetical protein
MMAAREHKHHNSWGCCRSAWHSIGGARHRTARVHTEELAAVNMAHAVEGVFAAAFFRYVLRLRSESHVL